MSEITQKHTQTYNSHSIVYDGEQVVEFVVENVDMHSKEKK